MESQATKAFGPLDRRLKVLSEALESSKEINFLFPRPIRESHPCRPRPDFQHMYIGVVESFI